MSSLPSKIFIIVLLIFTTGARAAVSGGEELHALTSARPRLVNPDRSADDIASMPLNLGWKASALESIPASLVNIALLAAYHYQFPGSILTPETVARMAQNPHFAPYVFAGTLGAVVTAGGYLVRMGSAGGVTLYKTPKGFRLGRFGGELVRNGIASLAVEGGIHMCSHLLRLIGS
jgi:hypothetical protein